VPVENSISDYLQSWTERKEIRHLKRIHRHKILNVQQRDMMEDVGMNHIHSLLAQAGIPPNTTSLSLVSIIGCKESTTGTEKQQRTFIDAANSIAGDQAFSSSNTVYSFWVSNEIKVIVLSG
jgi:hypothetical protein